MTRSSRRPCWIRRFPEILKGLFNIDSPAAPRNDLLAVVLGVDGLTRRPGEVVSDQLRLNVAVFPTPPSLANRMGVLGGDLAGFPNGRRPYDDVVDIELQILAGVLVQGFNVSPNNALGDGVDGPDKAYNPAFPVPRHSALRLQPPSRQRAGDPSLRLGVRPVRRASGRDPCPGPASRRAGVFFEIPSRFSGETDLESARSTADKKR